MRRAVLDCGGLWKRWEEIEILLRLEIEEKELVKLWTWRKRRKFTSRQGKEKEDSGKSR